MLLVGGLFGGGAQATPARQVPAFGSVQALALDANGDGWAWAGPHGPDYNTNFLLRIEGGAYRVAASTARQSHAPAAPAGNGADRADGGRQERLGCG